MTRSSQSRTDHAPYRRFIQLQLDGLLAEDEAVRLEAHLRICSDCRNAYAQYRRLDTALRRDSQLQQQVVRTHPVDLRAFEVFNRKSRANTSNRILKSFANALVAITLLAGLAGGLAWLLSTQLRLAAGSDGRLPAPPWVAATASAPAVTPLPEVSTPEQVIVALQALAAADAAQYRNSGWAHFTSESFNNNGEAIQPGTFAETWTRIIDGQPFESITVTKDRRGGEKLLQLQVRLADGTFGDLIELRRGLNTDPQSGAGKQPSTFLPADTDAGRLAARLAPGENPLTGKAPNELKEVHARYETQTTGTALVVEAVFNSTGSVPEVQREVYTFDLRSGQLLLESVKSEWTDGSPFSEFSRQLSFEFLAALPPEIERLVTDWTVELQGYLDPVTGLVAAPTRTPLPSVAPAALDGTIYTPSDPLTDNIEILRTLEALRAIHSAHLATPGWYLQGPASLDGLDWTATYSSLFHSLPDGTCEQMYFYWHDGHVQTQEVRLANGDWVFGYDLQAGQISEGKAGDLEHPCLMETSLTIEILDHSIDFHRTILAGEVAAETKVWVETIGDRSAFVLFNDIPYTDPKPVTMDPDTRKLETEARSQEWIYFDLETGAHVGGAYRVYLENGKIFGEPHQPGAQPDFLFVAYPQLPEDLAKAFEAAVLEMRKYLSSQVK